MNTTYIKKKRLNGLLNRMKRRMDIVEKWDVEDSPDTRYLPSRRIKPRANSYGNKDDDLSL